MKSTKFAYSIHTEKIQGSAYAHLHFTIRPVGHAYSGDFNATVKFQTDNELRDGKRCGWYGPSITAAARHADDLGALARIITRAEKTLVDRKDDTGQDAEFSLRKMTPANFAWALEQIRIPRAVYDARTSEFTPIAELPDLGLSRWTCKHDSVLAESESDAKRAMRRKLANSSYVSSDELANWLSAGSPVEVDTRSAAPVVQTIEEAVALPFHPGVELAPGYC